MVEHTDNPATCRVLCLGDMAADIFASPMPRLPNPGEVGLTEEICFFPGGNALNTAVALQRLGEQVRFIGSVGDDAFGDLLLSELHKRGLEVSGVTREIGCNTPTTLILRAIDSDRQFVHALGAGERFTGENIPLDSIPHEGVLLIGGYLKLRRWNDEALRKTLELARERGCRVVLNVCIPIDDQAEVDLGRCLRLLPLVDVFLPNEDEARLITGETEPELQAKVLRKAGAGLVIITRGAKGLYARDAKRIVRMGAYAVPMVDPSGCGDCFTAGLIAAMLRQRDLVPMLELASAVGALGATALGCTSGVPALRDVERFLKNQKSTAAVELIGDES